jgi:hypothetical protein
VCVCVCVCVCSVSVSVTACLCVCVAVEGMKWDHFSFKRKTLNCFVHSVQVAEFKDS